MGRVTRASGRVTPPDKRAGRSGPAKSGFWASPSVSFGAKPYANFFSPLNSQPWGEPILLLIWPIWRRHGHQGPRNGRERDRGHARKMAREARPGGEAG